MSLKRTNKKSDKYTIGYTPGSFTQRQAKHYHQSIALAEKFLSQLNQVPGIDGKLETERMETIKGGFIWEPYLNLRFSPQKDWYIIMTLACQTGLIKYLPHARLNMADSNPEFRKKRGKITWDYGLRYNMRAYPKRLIKEKCKSLA